MLEAYQIGVSLILETNVPSAIAGMMKTFEELDRIVKTTQVDVAGLAAGIRGLTRTAAGINSVTAAMEKLAKAAERAGAGATGFAAGAASAAKDAPSAAAGAERMASAYERAAKASGALVPAPRQLTYDGPPATALVPAPRLLAYGGGGSGGDEPPRPGGRDEPFDPRIPLDIQKRGGIKMPSLTTDIIAGGVVDFLWKSTVGIAEIQSKMVQTGFTPEQVRAATGAAYDAQQSVPGLSLHDAMELQLDAGSITKDADAARAMLPGLSGAAVVLGQFGKGDQIGQLFKAMQSGELRNALLNPQTGALDIDRYQHFIHELEAAVVASGGRIGPSEVLAFLQNSGNAGRVIDQDQLFGAMLPIMMSINAKKAGTGLQAFYQQFAVGRMSEAAANLLEEMHLVTSGAKLQKVGIGQFRMLPGGLVGEDQILKGDAIGYVRDHLVPAIHAYDMKNYGRDDPNLQATTAQAITSRIPGGKFLADIVALIPLIEKYDQASKATSIRELLQIVQDTNPQVALTGLTNAFSAFSATLTSAAMPAAMDAMKGITAALNAMSNGIRWFGGGQPDLAAPRAAPDPSQGWHESGPAASRVDGPTHVIVDNTGDLARAHTEGMANSAGRMPTGPTNYDTRLSLPPASLGIPAP